MNRKYWSMRYSWSVLYYLAYGGNILLVGDICGKPRDKTLERVCICTFALFLTRIWKFQISSERL